VETNRYLTFIIMTFLLAFILGRYLRSGIDGVLHKHMWLPSPFSWEWRKKYELHNLSAQIVGILVLGICGGFVYSWLWFLFTEFLMR